MAQRPGWLDELIGVVELLCADAGKGSHGTGTAGDSPGGPAKNARNIGRVTADGELGAGWFWIGLDGRSLEDDQIEAAFLAPAEGPENHKFQVIESSQEGRVLKVRVAEHAPRQGLWLWIPQRPRGLLDRSLLEGLSSISEFGLVNQIAAGRADAIAGSGADRNGDPSLNDGQRQAWRACRAPGVHLVWGPPGTGKTMVIAAALQDLMAAGQSVLLVSGTNIAVDNALARAAKAIQPAPGHMVRAGRPHLAEVADNPAICLQKLVLDRQQALEQQRLALEKEIAGLAASPDRAELAAAEEALASFDPAAYEAAATRQRDHEQLDRHQDDLARLLREATDVAQADIHASNRLQLATSEHSAATVARQHLAEAASDQRDLAEFQHAVAVAETAIAKFENERDRLAADLLQARQNRRFGHGRLKGDIRETEELRRRATERRDKARDLLRQQSPYLEARIARHEAAALPWTRAALAALDQRLQDAQRESARLAQARKAHARRARELSAQIAELRAKPRVQPGDGDLLSRAAQHDLPRRHAELPGLRQRAQAIDRDIDRLERRHEDVLSRMHREAAQVRREIVAEARVVASTLALLRMRPELREREYDHVLVDEVSFASAPEVIYAASRARQGVTLLGDFLQNGPIEPDRFRDCADPRVRRWYFRDCFAFFGITDAQSALRNPGCAVLTRQYRFGPVITELANAVAYGGVLQAAESSPAGPGNPAGGDGQAEIVLIDVDGLGEELTRVRPGHKGGKWWPVGALLAESLAAQRVRRAVEAGQPAANQAGIVTPYVVQQDLVRDILNESGASEWIETGTSHRFQGREFDTVIFDLVEDGNGWVAGGDLAGASWAVKGLRMFNVGITRARGRLYLIANGAAVRRADKGPLRAIRQLLEAGKVHLVPAAAVLGLPEAPGDDYAASELWHALRGYATLLGLHDEETLPAELARRIDAARTSVWLWSPWAGQRSAGLLPHLIAAQARGVRVHPVVLPRDEVTRHLPPRHAELAARIPQTLYLRGGHPKLILIDDNLAFLGSMSVLPDRPGRHLEVMALFQSRTLVSELMAHERTDELANPPACPRCGSRVTLIRLSGSTGRLHWHCAAEYEGQPCDWRRPFPDRPGGRNQPRR